MDCVRGTSSGLYCTKLRNRTSARACFSHPSQRRRGFAQHSFCKQPWDCFIPLNKELMQRHPVRTRCLTHKVLNWNDSNIRLLDVCFSKCAISVCISLSCQWQHFLSKLKEQCLFVVLVHLLAAPNSIKQIKCYKEGERKIQQLLK